jgi:hypothetical protein
MIEKEYFENGVKITKYQTIQQDNGISVRSKSSTLNSIVYNNRLNASAPSSKRNNIDLKRKVKMVIEKGTYKQKKVLNNYLHYLRSGRYISARMYCLVDNICQSIMRYHEHKRDFGTTES